MKPLFAIAGKTVRSAIRSRIVHILLLVSAFNVCVLPMTLAHDGTPKGLVQIGISYTLSITGILLSFSAVWLAATLTAEDIEGYQIHMVVTKPVGRVAVLLGKWLGVITLLGAVLVINVVAIYGMCHLRLYLNQSRFKQADIDKMNDEVLVGRREYLPFKLDLQTRARMELDRRIKLGLKLKPAPHEGSAMSVIEGQLSVFPGTIEFNRMQHYVFKGLPSVPKDDVIHLRYRLYFSGDNNTVQRPTNGIWIIKNPHSTGLEDFEFRMPFRGVSGASHSLRLPAGFISDTGELNAIYVNLDPKRETVVIQETDGPALMVGSTSFLNNYARVCTLMLIQIMFMATLGCAAGASMSTPMAVFSAISYVSLGLLVRYVRISQEGMVKDPQRNLILIIFDKIGDGVQACTFSLNEYVEIGALVNGRLVEFSVIAASLIAMIFFRGLPIVIIGMVGFYRRELGLVVRK